MTYRVIREDGKNYGPALVDDLKRLLADGSIERTTVVEDETGARCTVAEVPGIEQATESAGAPSPAWIPEGTVPVVPDKSSTWVVPVVLGCGVVFAGVAVLCTVLFPVFVQARLKAEQNVALGHGRELGRAVLLYAEDHDDYLPLNLSSATAARPAIAEYMTDDAAFHSPNPNGGEFLGNPKIAGTTLHAYVNPARIVLFYESLPWTDRKRAVVWLDGHEKMVLDFDPSRDLGAK